MDYDVKEFLWDTTPLYPAPDAAELERDFSEGTARARQFRESYLGKVAALDAELLKDALIEFEAIEELLVKPQMYAQLLFSGDSGDDLNKTLSQRAAELGNLMTRELLFFDLEITGIPD